VSTSNATGSPCRTGGGGPRYDWPVSETLKIMPSLTLTEAPGARMPSGLVAVASAVLDRVVIRVLGVVRDLQRHYLGICDEVLRPLVRGPST